MPLQSPELVPTTDRTAELISRMHGFNNISELSAYLPDGAKVLDVGAGASPFGREVAALRPDISWINFDYSYSDPKILEEVSRGAPRNIRFVSGDATKLGELYKPESFDAVFSYWMMPHLSIEAPEPAVDAAKAMFSLAKEGALISVGPMVNEGHFPTIRSFFIQAKAQRVVKNGKLNAEIFANTIVSNTTLPRFSRFAQKTANEVITPMLGTSRWATYENNGVKLYHRELDEYVPTFSKLGLIIVKDVVLAGSRHVVENQKPAIRKAAVVAGILGTAIAGRAITKRLK